MSYPFERRCQQRDPFHPSVGHISSIDVKSEGSTLAIQIRGNNKAANKDILGRAQQLTTPTTDVTVEQVGNASRGAALLSFDGKRVSS